MGDEEVLVTIQALRGHVCCSRLYCTVQVVTNRVPREGEELEKEKKEEKKEKERRWKEMMGIYGKEGKKDEREHNAEQRREGMA